MGLRGIVSGIISLSHGLNATIYGMDLQTSALMPLFFLLSGFSLSIVYGAKPLSLICTSSQVGGVEDVEALPAIIKGGDRVDNDGCQPLNIRRFFWNRFSRVMPTYYLCTLLLIPMIALGYQFPREEFPYHAVISFFPVSSLFNPPEFPIVEPAWFLNTLIWLWVLFPCWITRAQRKTDEELVASIAWWFYFQTLFIVCYFLLHPFPMFQLVMAMDIKCHPLTRFPLFLMGMYAGLLCLRHPSGHLPWPSSVVSLFPTTTSRPPLPLPSQSATTSSTTLEGEGEGEDEESKASSSTATTSSGGDEEGNNDRLR